MATFDAALGEVRAICTAFPEVNERLSHGAPTFFIRDKKTFCTVHDNHHGAFGVALWCAAPAGVQVELVDDDPVRYFRPPYVGHRGWLGVRLDGDDVHDDWAEVAAILRDAYRTVAPAKLAALLEG